MAGFLLLPLGGALLLAPRAVFRPLLGSVFVFLILLVPPAFAAPTLRGAVFSRSLYPVMLPLAAALGVAAAALRERCGLRVTMAILLLSSVPAIDFQLQTRCAHAPLPALVASRFAAIEAAVADAAPGSLVVAAGHDDLRQPWPVLGGLLDRAFRPPFREPKAQVVWFRDAAAFLASPLIVQWPGPIVLLMPDGDAYRRAGPPLPALGDGLAGVRLVEPNPDRSRWLVEPPVAARAVRAIGCDLPAGETALVRLVVETEDGEFLRSASLAASASPRRLGAVFDGDLAYVARHRVVAVRVEGLRTLRAPELLPEAPVLAFRGPLQGAVLSIDALPEFRFGPQPKGVILRVDVEMIGGGTWWPAMTYTLFADALPRDPTGELVFVPGDREPRTSPLHPLMRFGYLRPLYEQFLASFGLERLRFRARASAFAGTAETEISRSAWISFDALP